MSGAVQETNIFKIKKSMDQIVWGKKLQEINTTKWKALLIMPVFEF